MYSKFFKRWIDIVLCLLVCPIVLLVIIVFAPFIYFEDKGSIFYKAKRRGQYGTVFNMLKLRTMKVNAPDIRNEDNSTFNSENDPRVTKVGRVLRKTSLDEFPQFLNVIKGDMSLIGPRPVMTDKPLSEYDQVRIDRLKVKPGITGLSQAYYRNSISQEEKMKIDAEYANTVTFVLDIKIIFKTLKTVLLKENIYIE
ncbi:sugar transferase [Vagococcus sp. PNs007]|uniref:Sugar transferase n=1 Tax=Vagococcus proximus TaxID=2991417 RepID=A0ABT5X022_9ENTE|nr:sugar transferase [Vagococcus proximus]MDF0479334.1 sugar transferase [Vagococcus proximus]